MTERTLLWLLIAILVIVIMVKMCKNNNEGMNNKFKINYNSDLPPTFKDSQLYDDYPETRGGYKDYHYNNNKVYQQNNSNLPSGNYTETCSECSFANDTLSCVCLTMKQKSNLTKLKTDKCNYIQNCDGHLMCVYKCPNTINKKK